MSYVKYYELDDSGNSHRSRTEARAVLCAGPRFCNSLRGRAVHPSTKEAWRVCGSSKLPRRSTNRR